MLDKAKADVLEHHNSKSISASRYGKIGDNGFDTYWEGGCFYGIQKALTSARQVKDKYLYAIFHGDGAPLSFKALADTSVFNTEMQQHTQPFSVFKGTARSLIWVKYLLDERSPWHNLLPFLAEQDPEFINNGGFIFSGLDTLPSKLFYNFVMGFRFPWEMPRAFGTWLELCRNGVEGNLALYTALNFTLNKRAESIQGPWDECYPWSSLEETCYEAVGRFVTGRPGTTRPHEPCSPNVHPLWQIQDKDVLAEANGVFKLFCDNKELMLPDIIRELSRLIETQRKHI